MNASESAGVSSHAHTVLAGSGRLRKTFMFVRRFSPYAIHNREFCSGIGLISMETLVKIFVVWFVTSIPVGILVGQMLRRAQGEVITGRKLVHSAKIWDQTEVA